MGLYINPPNETKESFLEREGTRLAAPAYPPEEGSVLVCLIDNRIFTAAGVCYSLAEYKAFTEPGDGRPRKWYTISKQLLPRVTGEDLGDYLPEFKRQ